MRCATGRSCSRWRSKAGRPHDRRSSVRASCSVFRKSTSRGPAWGSSAGWCRPILRCGTGTGWRFIVRSSLTRRMRGASERNGRRAGCGVDKGSLDWSFPRRQESRELRWYLDPRLRGDDGRLSGRRGEAFLDPRLREDDGWLTEQFGKMFLDPRLRGDDDRCSDDRHLQFESTARWALAISAGRSGSSRNTRSPVFGSTRAIRLPTCRLLRYVCACSQAARRS